jgi:Cell Wall Hydrolase
LFGQKGFNNRRKRDFHRYDRRELKRKIHSAISGGCKLLTRSIAHDPFDLTIEDRIFRGAKRICTISAVAAMTLSALNLANIRSVGSAAAFIQDNHSRIADLPDRIRSEIDRMSLASYSPSVTVAIPRDDIAEIAWPIRVAMSDVAIRVDESPVAQLAAARHLDAVEFAMESPPASVKPVLRMAAEPAPVAAPRSEPMKLASVDPHSMPTSTMPTEPLPVSLPMSAALPLDMVPVPVLDPRPVPGVPSPAQRLHLDGKGYAKAERCLANAIYFEARSEPVRGQMAVAQVVINRAFSGFYPNDICGVVYQNASRHLACQFTFACDGKRKIIKERGAWAGANRIAKEILDGQIYAPEVAKSTHYHTVNVLPNWVHEMKKMGGYGMHNFYRPIAWGSGNDEPAWGSGAMASAKKKN